MTIEQDFDTVEDALAWHEYGNQDDRRAAAKDALSRIREAYDGALKAASLKGDSTRQAQDAVAALRAENERLRAERNFDDKS